MTPEPIETNQAYRDMPDEWRCPICWRGKGAIVRRTKTGRLKAFVVAHHDHFVDFAAKSLADAADRRELTPARKLRLYATLRHFIAWLTAFDPTLICEGCNHLEAEAKRRVEAPSHFSFGPVAMRAIAPNGSIDDAELGSQWKAARMPLAMREYTLNGMINKSMAGAAWREMAPQWDGTSHWAMLFGAMADEARVDEITPLLRIGRR